MPTMEFTQISHQSNTQRTQSPRTVTDLTVKKRAERRWRLDLPMIMVWSIPISSNNYSKLTFDSR
jgi:hypothetical protein